MNHISEQDIQLMAEGRPVEDHRDKRSHLEQCLECMNVFNFYRTLAEAIKTENNFQLPPRFSDRVSALIVSEKERQSRWMEYLLSGGCILLGVIISVFYLTRSGIVSRWMESLPPLNVPQVDFGSQQPFVFLLYILAILVIFQAADKLLIHRKIHGNR